MQQIGVRLQTNRVNKLLTLLLLLLIALLALIALIGYCFVVNINTFSTKNRTNFEISHNLIILDSTFRRNANIMVIEFFYYYQFVLTSYLATIGFSSPAVLGQMTNNFNNMTAAIGGIDPYDFFYERRAATNEKWTAALKNYIVKVDDRVDQSNDKSLLRMIQGIRTSVAMFDNTYKEQFVSDNVSYFNYVSLFHMRAGLLLDFMKQLRPVMNDKEPPFKISRPIFMRLLDHYGSSVQSLKVIFNGTMGKVAAVIEKIKDDMLGQKLVDYHRQFTLISVSLLIMAVVYFCCVLGVCKYFNYYLHALLMSYKNMKYQEIAYNIGVNEQRIEVLNKHIFNEEELADATNAYKRIKEKKSGESTREMNSPTNNLKGNAGKKGKAVQRKIRVSVSRNFSYTSSKFFCLSSTGVLGMFGLFYGLLYSTSQIIEKAVATEELYFSNILNMIPVSITFQAYNLFVIYGNYIKIDGKYLEDYKDDRTIEKFVSFWNQKRSTVKTLFDRKASKQLENILWGDVCLELNMTKGYSIYAPGCYKHPATSKGYINFLELEKDEVFAARRMISNDTAFLESSKKNSTFPYLNYFLSENSVRMRVLQDSISDLFIEKLFTAVLDQLSSIFLSIEAGLTSMSTVGGILIVVAMIVKAVVTFRLISANTQVCRETFAIILPETIFNNPLIYNAFERHFIKQR